MNRHLLELSKQAGFVANTLDGVKGLGKSIAETVRSARGGTIRDAYNTRFGTDDAGKALASALESGSNIQSREELHGVLKNHYLESAAPGDLENMRSSALKADKHSELMDSYSAKIQKHEERLRLNPNDEGAKIRLKGDTKEHLRASANHDKLLKQVDLAKQRLDVHRDDALKYADHHIDKFGTEDEVKGLFDKQRVDASKAKVGAVAAVGTVGGAYMLGKRNTENKYNKYNTVNTYSNYV